MRVGAAGDVTVTMHACPSGVGAHTLVSRDHIHTGNRERETMWEIEQVAKAMMGLEGEKANDDDVTRHLSFLSLSLACLLVSQTLPFVPRRHAAVGAASLFLSLSLLVCQHDCMCRFSLSPCVSLL